MKGGWREGEERVRRSELVNTPLFFCVCVLLLQDLLQSCSRGGRRIVEDMCYERRRAEAYVCPSRTNERGGEGYCVKEGGGEEGECNGSSRLGIEPTTPGWLAQDPTTSPSGDLIPTIRGSGACLLFITAVPNTKLCAWGEEDSGGHVL